MKKPVNGTFFCTLLFVTMIFSAAAAAQGPGQSPLPAQVTTDVRASEPQGKRSETGRCHQVHSRGL
jgi:hypothetical protein